VRRFIFRVLTERTLGIARLGVVGYEAALALQNALVNARIADQIGDTLLLLEHPHTFTLGRGADERFILPQRPPDVPIHRVSRGGQVTYHGPGQLVGYPILKLEGRDRDVGLYLRRLEEAIIRALDKFDIAATRREKLTGVWAGSRKIASIGVGIRRWVTYHGLALNVNCELDYFRAIVPCGIDGCEMTSIEALTGAKANISEVYAALEQSSRDVFGYNELKALDGAALWHLMDGAAHPLEPRSQ